MNTENYYLGIDLGTSSAKAIARRPDGRTIKAKRAYAGEDARAWREAVKGLIADLTENLDGEIAAVAISSQVGTYVIDEKRVLSWQSSVGRAELDEIRARISEDRFLQAIGMRHPDLISYPLPRLLHIQRRWGSDAEVLMPKEILLRDLTGVTATDVFSMRGLADPKTGLYASDLLRALGIEIALPPLGYPTALVGGITAAASAAYGLPAGIPVYLGCNDFFAGLLGMGICNIGDAFDLSGTSEHLGYISSALNPRGFVSGGYFVGNCTYGGTKSSGAACDLAIRELGIAEADAARVLAKNPPVFLPYLCGERAPIFDEDARGVYFGLHRDTDRNALAYAALEGVVFSLYDIACSMEMPRPRQLICGGGSAKNPLMNRLRATLFDCEVAVAAESDASALGACMIAMTGAGVYRSLSEAISHVVSFADRVSPDPRLAALLRQRFSIYRDVYRGVKDIFKKFNQLKEIEA